MIKLSEHNGTLTLISIAEMLKLTKVQGHKIKGQGQIFKNVKKIVSTLNDDRMIGP